MRITFLFFLGTVMTILGYGQGANLVQNPSFEDTVLVQWQYSVYFPQQWNRPPNSITTPDLYMLGGMQGSDCNANMTGIPQNSLGYSFAQDGNVYLGILNMYTQGNQVNSREYLQTQLATPLVAGATYQVGMYVKRASKCRYALNGMGILLSDTAVSQNFNQYINQTPQVQYTGTLFSDTTNWTLIQGMFVAQGGEQFLTIGNFKDDASSNITLANPAAPGSSLSCWRNFYSGYYYVDNVSVKLVGDVSLDNQEDMQVSVSPNPCFDKLRVRLPIEVNSLSYQLIDVNGKVLMQGKVNQANELLDLSQISAGLYSLHLRADKKTWVEKICKYEK
ncbi:MAG: T9SS type A sorting domain-containing protein [Bacteroidia bacterium]